MKYSLILGFFLLCICAQKSQAFHDKAMEEHFAKCAEEEKLTKEEIEQLQRKENLTNKKYECLAKCIGEKDGLIKNGRFNKEGAREIAKKVYKDNEDHQKKAEEVVEACDKTITEKTLTGCDIGPAVFGCLIEGAQKHKILPKTE